MKRVLIIAYYWPPSAGSGVQRWLKFSKYLPKYDWQPVIYTPENPDFSLKDEGLLNEVAAEAEILKTPIWEPYQLGRKLFGGKKESSNSTGIVVKKGGGVKQYLANWVRGNIFVPDPKVYWRKPSVKFLEEYLKKNPVDVIISTGTPHSMHLIALDLSKKLKLPWIADFRDPWSELDMLKSYHILPFRMKKYKSLEKEVISTANISLTTSQVWAEDFERLGARRAEVITNGYDETDFNQQVTPYTEFVISHFGLLNHLRNPESLWHALEELCVENVDFAKDLRLHLGGTIDPANLDAINGHKNLREKLVVFPYLSHEEVVKEYLKSTVLLLLLFNSESGKGNIPGKLFEYLASKKSILAFGPKGGDSQRIISESNVGTFHSYNANKSEIKKELLKSYKKFRHGITNEAVDVDSYSRSNLTKKLSNLLNELTSV